MNISPSLAAVGAAALVAVAVAFVLRPPQLAPPHPGPELSAAREATRPAPAAHPRALVYVAGAVVHAGVYAVPADARAQDALAKAGGATRDADLVAVNLAAHIADGDEIAVPRQGESRPATRAAHRRTAAAGEHRSRRRPRRDPPGGEHAQALDLNRADERALSELPGIGPTLATRIVEFREVNGPFVSVDGLADVAGITPARLDALAPLLTTGR